jgi:4-aminobutyrate aminotransferase
MKISSESVINKQNEFVIPCTGEGRYPILFEEGKGAILRDSKGKEYIDCHGGYSVTTVGHCNPQVVDAVKKQVDKLWHVSGDFYTEPTTMLAEKLSQITPGNLRSVIFSSSGGEAVENAAKIAFKYAFSRGKNATQIISLNCSFHGRTSFAMALTGQSKYKHGLGSFVNPNVVHMPPPYCYRCPFGLEYPDCALHCANHLEEVIKYETNGEPAAFISEPILGEGGIIVPPEPYLKQVVKIIRAHGGVYIADEVQTGFARTGRLFGVEHFGVEPDIMTMAKGIASGLPIAATIAKPEISRCMESIDHCSTYGGNAVMCAAALENIRFIEREKLDRRASELGEIFMDEFKEMEKDKRGVGEVRGKGLMIGIEIVKDKESKKPDPDRCGEVRAGATKEGVLINTGGVYGNVIRIQPPLVISEEQVKKVCEYLKGLL